MRLFGNNPRYERWRWQILTGTCPANRRQRRGHLELVFASAAASILLAGFLRLPKWNALPLTAGDAKAEACQEED